MVVYLSIEGAAVLTGRAVTCDLGARATSGCVAYAAGRRAPAWGVGRAAWGGAEAAADAA